MALLVLVILAPAFAEMPKIEGSIDKYFTDNYFWRAAGDGEPHFQYDFVLATSVAGVGISFSPWISHNLDNKDVDEVDYTLGLDYSVAGVSASGGLIYYDITGAEETTEVYGSVGYELALGEMVTISPGATFYYDFVEVDNPYMEVSLSAGAGIIEKLSASIDATLGLDFGQYETNEFDGGPTVLQVGVSTEYEIMENIALAPVFTYVIGLDDIFDSDHYFGLNIGFGF
jgi:hypothetical protein